MGPLDGVALWIEADRHEVDSLRVVAQKLVGRPEVARDRGTDVGAVGVQEGQQVKRDRSAKYRGRGIPLEIVVQVKELGSVMDQGKPVHSVRHIARQVDISPTAVQRILTSRKGLTNPEKPQISPHE